MNDNYSIVVKDLTKKFGSFTAVNNISFDIEKGEIFGFLGPNGAGKTTTIRMLCSILDPSSGSATVAGFDISKQSEEVKKRIGYMSQKFSLYNDLTVEENIDLYAGLYQIPLNVRQKRKEDLLKMTELEERKKDLPLALPPGIKQRLALECAIIHKPEIVFLDEPTAGVDPISRRKFWDIIKGLSASGTTILVTSHYMDEVNQCDRISLIYDGNLIALDSPEGIIKMAQSKDLEDAFIDLILKEEKKKHAAQD
ncbi:MAG: ABC transporter ATP-binding protein [Candidatus Margulisbacteria bacterium]|nr:ABC transporter ATP-binding protein [Candidatus Margulisiibacteriota bacterium]